MYVSSYSPVQSALVNPSYLQSMQMSSMGIPYHSSFVFPMQQSFAGAQPFQSSQIVQPWHSGIYSSIPYNVVSYTFSPAWQSGVLPVYMGSISPNWSWNQAGIFPGFQNFTSNFMSGLRFEAFAGMTQPRVELAETNNDIVITAELPNVNPNDLNLTVTDDSVSISALAFSGNTAVPIHRTICLPTTVKSEQVNATFTNGILEARLPKSDVSVRRKIKVNPSI
ncbi:MAG: Heat shock protein Hsp20 [Clostridia bacterium 41_269]|nr:MAG: Heat shock protein Hsp20 [Clostridia bacterium 41_269]